MQEITPETRRPEETAVPTRQLDFNDDGTVDPEQLVGFPQDFIDRVTSPEFIAEAKKQIQLQKAKDRLQREMDRRARKTGRREIRGRMVPYTPSHKVVSDPSRRPDGISGRQRKRMRRAASKLARATILSGVQTDGKP